MNLTNLTILINLINLVKCGQSGQSGQMWSIWSNLVNLVKSGQVWSNLVVLVVWSPSIHIFRGPKKQPFLIVYSTHGVYLYHTPGDPGSPTGGGYARG